MGPSTVIDRVARPALQVIFVLVALLSSAGPTTVMVAWSASYVLGLVAASVVLLYKKRKRHQNDRGSRVVAGGLQGLLGIHPSTILRFNTRVIVQWLDVVLVGAMLDARSAAIYAFATRLLQFGLFVANSVGQVVRPAPRAPAGSGQTSHGRGLYQVATGWQVAVTWPQYLIVAAFAAVLLRLLFGADFGDGAPVVLILAISTLVGAAAGPVSTSCSSHDREKHVEHVEHGCGSWSKCRVEPAAHSADRDPRGSDCLGGGESCGQRASAHTGVQVGLSPLGPRARLRSGRIGRCSRSSGFRSADHIRFPRSSGWQWHAPSDSLRTCGSSFDTASNWRCRRRWAICALRPTPDPGPRVVGGRQLGGHRLGRGLVTPTGGS